MEPFSKARGPSPSCSGLYANYLGGSLNLVSLPGFGTHAYVFFPRLNHEQVEIVPDKDHPVERYNSNVM